jgi:hypothetical protein
MLDEEIIRTSRAGGLRIQIMEQNLDITMPAVHERNIPANRSQIASAETVRKIPHLTEVADKLHPYRED